jgi:hypothetical protein
MPDLSGAGRKSRLTIFLPVFCTVLSFDCFSLFSLCNSTVQENYLSAMLGSWPVEVL